jgi:enamine deaminase RidA (YjgF/YER057c/UK114 family)
MSKMTRFDIAPSPLPGCAGMAVAGAVRAGERVFLSAGNALRADGTVAGPGDAAAQTHAALDRLEAALAAAGGSLANLTKLTTCVVDRGYRADVYRAIAERLAGVHPVSTGLVVAGLARPELIVQIDAEAAIPTGPVTHTRRYSFESWHGQGFPWEGAMVLATDDEFFLRGQTGSGLDHSGIVAKGRAIEDARAQADLALTNLAVLLEEAGGAMEDVCKITVYVSDRAYREAVYPMIGKHFGDVRPVSTGIVTTAFARPDILFELDVVALRRKDGRPHERLRAYHSSTAKYGTQTQPLDCKFCMAVVAGDRIILRGQTGTDLDERLHGRGDAAAQAEQAMDNVERLLAEAGAGLGDVAKATVYVTESDFSPGVNPAILKRFGEAAPALATLVVKGLASPELLMEVDITAIRGGSR